MPKCVRRGTLMRDKSYKLQNNFVQLKSLLRKFLYFIKPDFKNAKSIITVFGGAALVGTAVVAASSAGGTTHIPDHQFTPQAAQQTTPLSTPTTEDPAINIEDDPVPRLSHSSANASNQEGPRASVNVNGENIELNGDGEIHRTIVNGNSTTKVDISVNSGTNNSSSSHTHVQSHSYSSGSLSITIDNTVEADD